MEKILINTLNGHTHTNGKHHDEDEGKWFSGDASRLLYLFLLYVIQGVAWGFLADTIPIMLKRHFDYTEIGIISFCSIGYDFKCFFSPLVDTKYFKFLGKRRSWILPTQILCGLSMIYLADAITEYVDEKRIFTITVCFGLVFTCLAFQDISVDGWSITMVKEENSSYAASMQSIGIAVGIFISTTLYLFLNSVEFCNTYIYDSHQKEPLLNEVLYLKLWGYFVIVMSAYTLTRSEKEDRRKSDELEISSFKHIAKVTYKLVTNKNMVLLFLFFVGERIFGSFFDFMGKVYLLDDLGYSQDKYSYITLILFPLEIALNLVIAKF